MTNTTRTSQTTSTTNTAQTPDVEQLLRDAAFVLRMTRRVKKEILRDAAGPVAQLSSLTDLNLNTLGV